MFFAASAACSVTAEPSPLRGQTEGSSRPPAADVASRETCTPEVVGLSPAASTPLTIRCPSGYGLRDPRSTLPLSGRFTNEDELKKAFCVENAGREYSIARTPSDPIVDFETNDVVVYVYDARAGRPVLYRRGEELWLRVSIDSCTGDAPELANLAFAVPKQKEINEQTCATSCR